MVKSYCVKQKKQTECVPGSEQYTKAKNGRTMMKCTCAECGITKTKFVKSGNTGGSLVDAVVGFKNILANPKSKIIFDNKIKPFLKYGKIPGN